MIILTINKKGNIKLPKEVIRHLGNAQHLQIRLNPHGVTLTPVRIESAINIRRIPESQNK
jgi:hypothetical protein